MIHRRGMVGMKGMSYSIPDQQKSNLWIIENSNDGQIYTIDLDTKMCYKSLMPIKPLSCISGLSDIIFSLLIKKNEIFSSVLFQILQLIYIHLNLVIVINKFLLIHGLLKRVK